MRKLTNNEVLAVAGAQKEGYAIDWWRAGFDVAAGALGGAVLGAVGYSIYAAKQPGNALASFIHAAYAFGIGGAVGMGVGGAGGAVLAASREAWNYYHA